MKQLCEPHEVAARPIPCLISLTAQPNNRSSHFLTTSPKYSTHQHYAINVAS